MWARVGRAGGDPLCVWLCQGNVEALEAVGHMVGVISRWVSLLLVDEKVRTAGLEVPFLLYVMSIK